MLILDVDTNMDTDMKIVNVIKFYEIRLFVLKYSLKTIF